MHSPTPTAMGGAHVWTVSRNVCACLAAALAGEFRAVVGEHGAERAAHPVGSNVLTGLHRSTCFIMSALGFASSFHFM